VRRRGGRCVVAWYNRNMQGHPHELIWVAPEYEFREKTVSWYWISICLAVLLIAFAMWQKNYLFAVFLVIAEILILVWASEEPKLVKFSLSSKTLAVGNKKEYPVHEIEHFSTEDLDHKEWALMIIHFHHSFRLALKIHVPKHHLEDARAILTDGGAQEIHHKETLIETLEEFLGF
jgi:hypothetical protein